MSPLRVELVAADRSVWQGDASMVSVRGVEGDLGIMPGHTPLLAALAPGEIRILTVAGDRQTADIDGGFMSVDEDRVTIVSETVRTASRG